MKYFLLYLLTSEQDQNDPAVPLLADSIHSSIVLISQPTTLGPSSNGSGSTPFCLQRQIVVLLTLSISDNSVKRMILI